MLLEMLLDMENVRQRLINARRLGLNGRVIASIARVSYHKLCAFAADKSAKNYAVTYAEIKRINAALDAIKEDI